MEPSRGQVDRAGRVLRDLWRLPERNRRTDEEEDALTTIEQFRATHGVPLAKATRGLRSMVRAEGSAVRVSQRLKRTPTIIDKLIRQPTMNLSRMQDIGGCRAVLPTVEELRRVQRRLSYRRDPVRVYDYIATPRASGYRAVHLIVRYDSLSIEVQLRTVRMHEWAIAVERLGAFTGSDLKSSIGPPAVLVWLQGVADAGAIEEGGGTLDNDETERLAQLRADAAQIIPEIR